MRNTHIAILVNSYSRNGGASKSIRECAESLAERGHSVHILTNRFSYEKLPENAGLVRTKQDVLTALNEYDAEIVLFFKAAKSLVDKSIFSKFMAIKPKLDKNIRVITIVCQRPSNPNTVLTPFEINNSDHLIFIDKTAYYDPLYSFIPENRKSWTYLSIPDNGPNPLDRYVKTDYSLKNDEVVFGRGSSFNKCPKDILEPFDKVKVCGKKKFVIVGVPKSHNWLTAKINKRGKNDVVTYPLMGFDEWIEKVSKFDIGLYILPVDAHSSIDGTLGQMMRIGLPVIVGGAPAPKERIIHGENGFVADTVPAIAHYAELLTNDQDLRERMGKAARRSTLELNSVSWIDKLEDVMEKCFPQTTPVAIPFITRNKIYFIHFLALLKAWVIRPIKKVL